MGNEESRRLQSQKLEGIGQFAAGISHDFNNILAVILNFASFIAEEVPKDSPAARDAEEIRKAAERGVALTRQLLIFSRKEVVRPETFNPNKIISGVEKLIRSAVGESIRVVTDLDPEVSLVQMDPGQLEMVLMNLAVNARDAMAAGGILTLRTGNMEVDETFAKARPGTTPGDYVLLEVSDTGCGISPEILDRIFEPYFTTKPKDRGTGLGLSTVYGVVKRARGNIWAYSEVNVGTTFKVYLPVSRKGLSPDIQEPGSKSVWRGEGTILVVEDEDAVRQVIRRILEESGFTVLEARNGAEARDVACRHDGTIHLLLTDVIMPGSSGRELADHLTRERSNLRVLLMSGYNDLVIAHHGFLREGAAFLSKPFTRSGLLQAVREALANTPKGH